MLKFLISSKIVPEFLQITHDLMGHTDIEHGKKQGLGPNYTVGYSKRLKMMMRIVKFLLFSILFISCQLNM